MTLPFRTTLTALVLVASVSSWARVMAAVTDPSGVPPIEVYQIGQAYFVRDGNHRVSVASMAGDEFILADVYELSAAELEPNESCSRLGYSI